MGRRRLADTIVALSSGRPPAAIAVVRISGPAALAVARGLAGTLPAPRVASVRSLRDAAGGLLDRALVLVFPGPASATGEDLVEFHCHGGRAVIEAVQAAVLAWPGMRAATPGEFTRRAFDHGRIDLAQAQGLADLLEAETEAQRRTALQSAEGEVSRALRGWMERLTEIAALIEAGLDFADEGDVAAEAGLIARVASAAGALRAEMLEVLGRPPVERWRDGVTVAIGGPPNSGKSTLLNLLAQREAAIVSPLAGTTRDRVEASVRRAGVAYRLIDTAGLRTTDDAVERIGVARAEEAIATSDLLLWLGDEPPPRTAVLWVHARADEEGRAVMPAGRAVAVRQDRLATIDALWAAIAARVGELVRPPDALSLRHDQRTACTMVADDLILDPDPVLAAEQLRRGHAMIAALLGIDAQAAMLNALFSRFCLGK